MFAERNARRWAALQRQQQIIERGYTVLERALRCLPDAAPPDDAPPAAAPALEAGRSTAPAASPLLEARSPHEPAQVR